MKSAILVLGILYFLLRQRSNSRIIEDFSFVITSSYFKNEWTSILPHKDNTNCQRTAGIFLSYKEMERAFFLELVLSMCKSTWLAIGAKVCLYPTFAQLSLNLKFIIFWQNSSISFKCKWVVLTVNLLFLKHLIVLHLIQPYLFCILVIF